MSSKPSVPRLPEVVRLELPHAIELLRILDALVDGVTLPPTMERLRAHKVFREQIVEAQVREVAEGQRRKDVAAEQPCWCNEGKNVVCPRHIGRVPR